MAILIKSLLFCSLLAIVLSAAVEQANDRTAEVFEKSANDVADTPVGATELGACKTKEKQVNISSKFSYFFIVILIEIKLEVIVILEYLLNL